MEGIYQFIIESTTTGKIDKQTAVQLLKSLKAADVGSSGDIAIIGMAVNLPGASDVNEFWRNIREGADLIKAVPKSRKEDIEYIIRNLQGEAYEIDYNVGSFLEDIASFDHKFFRLSPKEARVMDPNQRLFLQTAWQAIENAGYGGNKLKSSNTGVFVGYSSDFGESYLNYVRMAEPSSRVLAIPANIKSIIASRIAYLLDLKGPSMLVDTACSSSLVAVHLACRSIRNKECTMALAGGVKINLMPLKPKEGDKIGIESSTGKTRTFDDASDGTGIGEGVAAILLKPLKKAIDDGDYIHAVIKGSAVNQDGNSIGITAPNSTAQCETITGAWKNAKVNPETVGYIEAHGTGTKLGDPIEIDGMEMSFGKYTGKRQFCAVGSVKTNLGHLDNAAGIVGLVKAAMILKNAEIPPSLHLVRPNRKISFEASPVYVNDALRTWHRGEGPRRCGISSFGLSGTNCHVVLEEAPPRECKKREKNDWKVTAISAKSLYSLKELVKRWKECLNSREEEDIEDLCITANTGRGHYNYRLAIIFRDGQELNKNLEFLAACDFEKIDKDGIYFGDHKTVVNFEGLPAKEGEITEEEKRIITKTANDRIEELQGKWDFEGLEGICSLYVRGADVDWEQMYRNIRYNKVQIPVYAFEKSKCWMEFENAESEAYDNTNRQKKIAHPLLDYCQVESYECDIFITAFRTDRQWELGEHKIDGRCVAPGTTYIEMVREVSRNYFGDKPVRMKNVAFLYPLSLDEGEIKEVQTVIKTDQDAISFSIVSRNRDGTWIKHAEGNVEAVEEDQQPGFRIDEILERCKNEVDIERVKSMQSPIKTGPRWDNLIKLSVGENEVLAKFRLGDKFEKDINQYSLHPALMDCAVNLAMRTIGEGLYLPFVYESLKVFEEIPVSFYSYLKRKYGDHEGKETGTFDVILADEQGKVIACAEGYTLKKANRFQTYAVSGIGILHKAGWVPGEKITKADEDRRGTTIIFKGKGLLSDRITELLKESGGDTVEVSPGGAFAKAGENVYVSGTAEEDYRKLFEALKEKELRRIIYIKHMSDNIVPEALSGIEKSIEEGPVSLFKLAKSLLNAKITGVETIIITRNAVEVGNERSIIPNDAALIGLGKVIGQEYGEIKCRHIDLDEYTPVEVLTEEMNFRSDVYSTAYRRGERYIEKIDILDTGSIEPAKVAVRPDGVYVITGGTGGIGLEVAKYLASGDRVNLYLISRSGMPERGIWKSILEAGKDKKLCRKIESILEIEKNGSHVTVLKADVSNEEEIRMAINEIKRNGRINGIIHGAGVAGEGFIINKNMDRFRGVLAPKVKGTWLLDNLTGDEELDFFVLFSSINSIFGGLGQGDYAAANLFMDCYGAYRNKKGKRTLTVNWAPWKETGMAADYGVNFEEGLFRPLSTKEAIEAFERVLSLNSVNRVIIGMPNSGRTALKDAQKAGMRAGRSNNRKVPAYNIKVKGKEGSRYNETETKIGEIWAKVLGLNEIDIYENFSDMGGDSILATQLLKELEKAYPGMVSIADVFSYSTVNEMSAYLSRKISDTRVQETEENGDDDEISRILNGLSKGSLSVNDAAHSLKSRR